MRIALCYLVANEEEFLRLNYEQHKHWPGVEHIVLVHGVCKRYAESNPGSATSLGFSTDGTGEVIEQLMLEDGRVEYRPTGWLLHEDPAQEKCMGRDVYLRVLDWLRPDWFIVVDADEFYPLAIQARVSELLGLWEQEWESDVQSLLLRQRHIWWSSSLQREGAARFDLEVRGGYWGVPHCRIYRWSEGLRYIDNHNEPVRSDGVGLHRQGMLRREGEWDPYCVHMGFARSGIERRVWDTNYYEGRGEGKGDGRGWYIECRRSWEGWERGDSLPYGGELQRYDGLVPEVFDGR